MLLLAGIFFPALLPLRSPAVPCISSSKAPHEHHWNVLCACCVVTWIMEIGILSPASCKSFLFSPSSSAVSCCTLHFHQTRYTRTQLGHNMYTRCVNINNGSWNTQVTLEFSRPGGLSAAWPCCAMPCSISRATLHLSFHSLNNALPSSF